jgi:hypothetical protein
MRIEYEPGDRVVDLRTGVHYTVSKALLVVNRDRAPITGHQALYMEGPDNRVLTSLEVRPVQHVIVLSSPMGEIHSAVIVPEDLTRGRSFADAEDCAEHYNQRLKVASDVSYADGDDRLEEWIRNRNGDS